MPSRTPAVRWSWVARIVVLISLVSLARAQVRISQIYGGGGNTGSQYLSDYVELYNAGSTAFLGGWSVQYAAASGTTWQVTPLPSQSLGTGRYLLVKMADGTTTPAGQSLALPSPEATGTVNLSATDGKVALVNTTSPLSSGTPTDASILDFVGYGAFANWNEPATTSGVFDPANNAPAPSNNNAILRNTCGGFDSNGNAANWAAAAPNPRNTQTAPNSGMSAGAMCEPCFAKPQQTIRVIATPYLCSGATLPAGTSVTLNASAIGGASSVTLFDNGTNGDEFASDRIWSRSLVVGSSTPTGTTSMPLTFTDGSNSGGQFAAVEVLPFSAPDNDNCATATPLSGSLPTSVSGNFNGATSEYNPIVTATPVGMSSRRGVWYSFAGTGHTMTVDTCQSPLISGTTIPDTVLLVAVGTCDAMTLVASNDEYPSLCGSGSGTELRSRASFCTEAGRTYFVWVGPFGGGAQTFSFVLTLSDDGVFCTGAVSGSICAAPNAGGAIAEREPQFGPANDDGCDSSPNLFKDVSLTAFPSNVFVTGKARAYAGNRDPDWYRFQAPSSALLSATVTGQTPMTAELYQLSSTGTCSGFAYLAGTANASQRCASASVSTLLTAGNWYALRVIPTGVPVNGATVFGGVAVSAYGIHYLCELQLGGPAINDSCSNATALALGGALSGTTLGATHDGTSSCDASGRDVWYAITTTTNGKLHVDTCGSAIDTALSLHSFCGSSMIACNDNANGCACSGPSSSLDVSGLSPGTYRLRVSDKLIGSGGPFTVRASFDATSTGNDACCDAITLGFPSTTNGSTTTASLDNPLPPLCDGPGVADVGGNTANTATSVWYRVFGNGQTIYADTLSANYDTKLSVYTGTCGALIPVTMNDDINASFQSKVAWASVINQTYYVMVHGYGASAGTFTLQLTTSPTPPNDDCAQPIVLSSFSGSIGGTNAGAAGAPSGLTSDLLATCATDFVYWDTWYSWTAPCSGNVTFATCGSFDTVVSVHTSCPAYAAGNQLVGACNNDGISGCAPGSQVTTSVSGGSTYLIRVATDGDHAIDPGGGGLFTLTWSSSSGDSDGDGAPDCADGCPSDPLKTAPGVCGCGVPDLDNDGDGIANCLDGCPNDPLKIAPGSCGCGAIDTYGCAAPTYAHRILEQSSPHDPCKPPNGPRPVAANVELATGAVVVAEVDLDVPSRGFPFRWSRTYDSRADFDGVLGHNWDCEYDRSVAVNGAGNASLVDGRGREDVYVAAGGGQFTSPKSIYASLVRNGNGTWTQREPDGTTYDFDTSGWLVTIRDRAGNQLTLTRNASHHVTQIVDTQGRLYLVQYTGAGASARVSSLTDFAGRQVVYTYDSNGDLVAVRSPTVAGTPNGNDFTLGKTTLYTYSSGFADSRLNHNLLSVIEPAFNVGNLPAQSKASRTFTYDPGTDPLDLAFDRVTAERIGHDQGGPPSNPNPVVGGTTTFTLSESPIGDINWPPNATRRCGIIDGNGNYRADYFDAERHTLAVLERTNRNVRVGEGDYITRFDYDASGMLVLRTDPRGNRTQYVYDGNNPMPRARGNVLEIRRMANGVGGGGPDIVERFTYEPVFNQLRTSTDPRAFPTGSVPLDGNGHLALTNPSVDRYTTTNFFDYQETTGVQAASGIPVIERIPEALGDQNGAVDFSEGNVVRVKYPTIQTSGPNSGQMSSETRTWNALGQLEKRADPEGSVTLYEYFATNGGQNDPSDREGYLKAVTEDSGLTPHLNLRTEFVRDLAGNPTSTIDPKGNATLVTFNALNQVVREQSRFVSGTLRYTKSYFYDANDNRYRVERDNLDENGVTRPHSKIADTFEFDILRNVVAQSLDRARDDGTLGGVARTEYAYDANCNRIAERAPEAVNGHQPLHVTTWLYDERDLLYKSTRSDSDLDPANAPPSFAAVSTLNYDGNRNLLESMDAVRNAQSPNAPVSQFPGTGAGDVTRYSYDGFDRRIATIDGEGNRADLVLDAAGNATRATESGPAVIGGSSVVLRQTDTTYDERSRAVSVDTLHLDATSGAPFGDGHSTRVIAYDREGKTTAVTDDNAHATTTAWDAVDRRRLTTDALGNQVELTYDANSNVLTRVQRDTSTTLGSAAETFTTTYAYDGLDRLVKTTDAAGGVFESFFDSRDNLVKSSDANRGALLSGPGNTTRYEYDALDRRVRTQHDTTVNGQGDGAPSPSGPVITLEWWDDNSRRQMEQDGNDSTTTYSYDALDRLIQTNRCDGGAWNYQYDLDGHRTLELDPNQSTTTYAYDGLDRRIRRDIVRGPGVVGSTYERFAYDGLDRLLRTENDDGILAPPWVSSWRHDTLDDAIEELSTLGTLQAQYDGASNRIYVVRPSGRDYACVYDALDRLVRASEPAAPAVVDFHFKGGQSREERRDFGNGSRTEYSYDALPRLIRSRTIASGGATQLDFQYGHDRMSQPLFERRVHESNRGQVYAYDSLSRIVRNLRSAVLGGVAAGQTIDPSAFNSSHEQRFEYDKDSNRVREVDQDLGLHAQTDYLTDCADVYTQVAGDFEPWGATTGLPRLRDANGNTTGDDGHRYEYDAKDRLVRVRDRATNAPQVEYSYDALDRLVRRHAFSPDVVTLFAYDGEQVVEEYNGSLQLVREYVWGLGSGDLIQERASGATWYAFADGRGNVVALANAAGALVERYDYDAFGRMTVVLDGSTGNPRRFGGEWRDERTDLLMAGGQAYEAGIGRGLQDGPKRGDRLCGNYWQWAARNRKPPKIYMATVDYSKPKGAKPQEQQDDDWWKDQPFKPPTCPPPWTLSGEPAPFDYEPGRKPLIYPATVDYSKPKGTNAQPGTEDGWWIDQPFKPPTCPPPPKSVRPGLPAFGIELQGLDFFSLPTVSEPCQDCPQSVLDSADAFWGFYFSADDPQVHWYSWTPKDDQDPTYAYDAVDRRIVTRVQDPPPVIDQETRERMVRDFIKKVQDNFPGERKANVIIRELRGMLMDNDVTDEEMERAKELMKNLF